MNISELKKTGEIHDLFVADWIFYGKAFRAGKPFISEAINRHPSESATNYNNRVSEAFNFPYCQNIVTIYNYFLTENSAIREIDQKILDLPAWVSFKKNADLYGIGFDAFLSDAQKLAGAYGTVGILVDYPSGTKDVGDPSARPYLSMFTPNNILDWKFERNSMTGIPELIYLKLKESTTEYLIWTKENWARYTLTKRGASIEKTQTGTNRLGRIPFVFMANVRDSSYPYLGISDLTDACYVNASIIRCLSMGNEALKLAGFPMLLFPKESENAFLEDAPDSEEEIIVSEDTVLQFDPDAKNGKPSWLESPVEASITAILSWIDRLTEEMYRAANLAGLHQNRDKAQTKSSTYLRYQFQQTNAVLSKKADSLIEAEKQINELFCLWESIEYDEDKMKVSRIKEFSIDALQTEIDNMVTAMDSVKSTHFRVKLQKRMGKLTYPDLTESDLKEMEDEIFNHYKKLEEDSELDSDSSEDGNSTEE